MARFKDMDGIPTAELAPATTVAVPGGGALAAHLAETYNRIGGFLQRLAAAAGIPVEAALAVWQVESGGGAFEPGWPILRFENHKFFQHWGRDHAELFDQHFQFGGRAGISGDPWKNHTWRPDPAEVWRTFHGDQTKEYEVFAFARQIGNDEAVCLSCSFGGPQILGSNFAALGYANASALFNAFQESERWHVCGFFDFCESNRLIPAVQGEDWTAFATKYNGSGQAAQYGEKIGTAYGAAKGLNLPAPPVA